MTSIALWIPLLWILILGSRPLTMWDVGNFHALAATVKDYEDGSPTDRNVYIFLIVIGLIVLYKRKLEWGKVFHLNPWVTVFFIYCAISVIWSDYPFVGFKRWIKDVGNVVMVLVVLTETDPVQAVRALFARYAYMVILLSVLFIKYYPEYGRYYHRWTYLPAYSGVTTEKNALGASALIAALLILWDLAATHTVANKKKDKLDVASRILLLGMAFWLLQMADSSAAIVSAVLGGGVVLLMQYPFFIRRVKYIGSYCLIALAMIALLYFLPELSKVLLGSMGEDITLTGRTDLWADLLLVPINQIVGAGYQSFWLGERAEAIWEKYYFHPNQAHNGYLETYLNGGLVGIVLLVTMIIAAGKSLKPQLLGRDNYAILRFSFLVVTVLYNITEAMFNRLSPVWIVFLFAVIIYTRVPGKHESGQEPGVT